ncbi:MAG: hypothetical protein RL260_2196, partial [Pseudomonadota bacterium]
MPMVTETRPTPAQKSVDLLCRTMLRAHGRQCMDFAGNS